MDTLSSMLLAARFFFKRNEHCVYSYIGHVGFLIQENVLNLFTLNFDFFGGLTFGFFSSSRLFLCMKRGKLHYR